jgi:hypothetical protein
MATSRKWTGRPGAILMVAALAVSAPGCGEDEAVTGPEAIPPGNNLVFRNPDGSTIDFTPETALYVWFEPWSNDHPVPSLKVGLASAAGGWYMNAAIADVEEGMPVTFPGDDEYGNVLLFVYDVPNELSSNEPGSTGSITFDKFPARQGEEVAFTIDAVIASEFHDAPSVSVTGTFRAVVGQAPPRQ